MITGKGLMNWLFKRLPPLAAGLVIILLTGCATYGDSVHELRAEISNGQAVAANIAYPDSPGTRRDELLFWLEKGMLQHLAGDYVSSNQSLETAWGQIDPLFGVSAADRIQSAIITPRNAKYRGTTFERAMITLVKSLNYLQIAFEAESEQAGDGDQWLEAARVEARRMRLVLDYSEQDELDSVSLSLSDAGAAKGLLEDVLGANAIRQVTPSAIPVLDWLAAMLYERLGETDNARIALEKAFSGYQQQLIHSPAPSEDILVLPVQQPPDGQGDVLIIQLAGLIAEPDEFSIFTGWGFSGPGLSYRASFSGPAWQQDEQAWWYYSVLSGPGGHSTWVSSRGRPRYSRVSSFQFSTNRGWQPYRESNSVLFDVLSQGFRVALSYYPSSAFDLQSRSRLNYDSREVDADMLLSLSRKVAQDHAENAWPEFMAAFARELVQQVIAEQLYRSTRDSDSSVAGLMGIMGKAGAMAGAQADTRAWLTLPSEIQVMHMSLPPGEHDLTLTTDFNRLDRRVRQNVHVDVVAGQTTFKIIYTGSGIADSGLSQASASQ